MRGEGDIQFLSIVSDILYSIRHTLQYQTYSVDAVAALDGDATISASGNNLFTDDDDDEEEEEEEEEVRSSFITVDM